jgi:hypothetical protein
VCTGWQKEKKKKTQTTAKKRMTKKERRDLFRARFGLGFIDLEGTAFGLPGFVLPALAP